MGSGGDERGASGAGSSGRIAKGLIVVAILGAVNIWQVTNREEGPDPAEEELHSPEEAVELCRTSMDSVFAGRGPRAMGAFVAGYLQGGEYEVMGSVELMVGRIRTIRSVVCELQFKPEMGWKLEHVELGAR